MRRAIRAGVALACVAGIAACASAGAAARVTAEATTFAPALEVDLASMTRLPGGAYYRDIAPGTGAEARDGKDVAVYYAGYRADGTRFEATEPPAPPVTFRMGQGIAIAGWERGLVGMRVGGERMLVIPPSLAYGARGTERVPPNAVLVFRVELVSVR